MHPTAVLDHIELTLDAARDRWFDLLRIPSVSAQPDRLAAMGFDAAVHATPGQPIVLDQGWFQ